MLLAKILRCIEGLFSARAHMIIDQFGNATDDRGECGKIVPAGHNAQHIRAVGVIDDATVMQLAAENGSITIKFLALRIFAPRGQRKVCQPLDLVENRVPP